MNQQSGHGNPRPEPEYFESEDFVGATPPPTPAELEARAQRARQEATTRAADQQDGGPDTQAMDPVPAAPAPTTPISEPQEAPFAPTAALAFPTEDTAPTAADPSRQPSSLTVPGVTDTSAFSTGPAPKRIFSRILQYVVAILTPFVVLIASIRAVASGAFLWLEYHRPGFPADAYGFSTDRRTTLGSYGLDFINGFASRSYLGDLRTPEGEQSLAAPKLFKSSEVGHMADVQSLVHLAYLVAVLAAVVIVVCLLVLRCRYAGGVRRGLFAGAWVTLGLLLVLGLAAVMGWDTFFTDFHRLFFSGGNWEFYADDTLIRLYPPQFWMDAAAVLGGLTVLACVILLCLTWPTRRRREASRNRQNARIFRLA